MEPLPNRIVSGLLGGAAGLLVMEAVRRGTRPFVNRSAPGRSKGTLLERSMSPLGPHHRSGEPATTALGRLMYEKLVGREPSRKTRRALSWGVHIGYGLLVAAGYGALRGRSNHTLRDGVLFGTALWALGDELAIPILGLADKPTAYPPAQHLQSLAQHLGFGVATATAAKRIVEGLAHGRD